MSTSTSPPPQLSRRDLSKTVSATKNLRAISMSLVRKVQTHPGMSSTDVANALAREAVRDVLRVVNPVSPTDLHAIEKNIRRRLYDSLKVLISVGAITRNPSTKHLLWRGISHLLPPSYQPHPRARNAAAVRVALEAVRVRLGKKTDLAAGLRNQTAAMTMLCRRNDTCPAPRALRIHLPFVVIRTPANTDITLDATPDAQRIAFEFSGYYEIVNDSSILDRLFVVKDRPASRGRPVPVAAPRPRPPAIAPPPPLAEDPSPGYDFSSPKRRRIASRSPFAKYTSGAKPPPSPAAPHRRKRITLPTPPSSSPENAGLEYNSPLKASLRALAEPSVDSPVRHNTRVARSLFRSVTGSPGAAGSSMPVRKRRSEYGLIGSESSKSGRVQDNDAEGLSPQVTRGFGKRLYGPGSSSSLRDGRQKGSPDVAKGVVDLGGGVYSGKAGDGEALANEFLLSPGVSPM